MTIRKVDPQPSAPRPVAKPSTPVTPKPAPTATPDAQVKLNAKTGRTSGFEAYRPPPVALDRREHESSPVDHRDPTAPSEGRGTNDDSVGRGTNDDSVGRGTNDDSIGRGTNDDSIGRGTNDDSIGRGTNDDSIGRGTNDDSIGGPNGPVGGRNDDTIGGPDEPTARGTALVPGREGLSKETAAQMDALVKSGNADLVRQAEYIFETPEFQAMPPEQRAQIVNVMSSGDLEVARGMAEMFEQSGGAMLVDKGKDGVTVLDSLERMAMSPAGKEVIGDVMFDLVRPGRIRQGRAPTCTVTSMQYELAQEAPGEYARLMAGLAIDGKVTMLGGGELVTDPNWAQYASTAARDGRTSSEAIFQAAAMEYANGKDTYLEYGQESVGGADGPYRGLHADQIRTMVGELFGVDYETRQIGSDAEADAELDEILSRERPNRPVLFDITIDGSDSNHCVSLEGVRNGQVYFRDPTTGRREHMPVEEFRQSLVAVHYATQPTGFFDKIGGAVGSAASAVGNAVGRFKGLFAF